MKNLFFLILPFLFCNTSFGQNSQSHYCKALQKVIESKKFQKSFSFCELERREKTLIIVDTINCFEGFIYKKVCQRNVTISNVWIKEESVNTIVAYRSYVITGYFALSFYCPATSNLCSFLFKEKNKCIKIIGSSSGTF